MTLKLLVAGGAIVLAGIALIAARVSTFFVCVAAVSSTSPGHVLRGPDGTLASYPDFALGFEPAVVALGFLVLAVALILRTVSRQRATVY